jgi:hypothetical protein
VDLARTLLELEQQAWQSLVDGRGRAHYGELLAPDAVVLGSGTGTADGEAARARLSGQRWSWFRLRGPRAVALGEDAAVISYRVIARSDFDVEYHALVTSTYRRDGDRWRLVVHQHTQV